MKRVHAYLILGLLLSCSPEKNKEPTTCYSQPEPPVDWSKISIDQGIAVQVWFWKGNFMPVGWGDICKVKRSVYIYELTTMDEADKIGYTSFFSSVHTPLIKKVETDAEGFFQLALEPGIYSVFVEEPDGLYANYYAANGISPVEVTAGDVTQTQFNITYEAVF